MKKRSLRYSGMTLFQWSTLIVLTMSIFILFIIIIFFIVTKTNSFSFVKLTIPSATMTQTNTNTIIPTYTVTNTSTATITNTPTLTPTFTNTPTITSTPTPTQLPKQITMNELCTNPNSYQDIRIRFRGEITTIDNINEAGVSYTRVQLIDTFPAVTKCIYGNNLSIAAIYYGETMQIPSSIINIGNVVNIEGVGKGQFMGVNNAGANIKYYKIMGDYIEIDPICVTTLEVTANPPNVFVYLDRVKPGTASPTATFNNVCPGRHSLSVLTTQGLLAAETWINIASGYPIWSVTYSYYGYSSGGLVPNGCFNCP